MQRLHGTDAIDRARYTGKRLHKYTDPTEEARDDLTIEEAESIACVDAGLIWIDVKEFANLEELRNAMRIGTPWTLDPHNDAWSTDLPSFGGDEPANTDGIWSWDEYRLLVGSCADDLEIIDRGDA